MNRSRGLFVESAIVYLAVLVPLALAEGVWWYLAIGALAVLLGWRTLAGSRRPLLGPLASRAFVVAVFGLLLFEYVWLMSIPVVALSHFMTLVCASKFLQRRTLRDDAQLMVLCLLLVVVAAIVSGNVIFLAVVLVYLTIGLDLLIRFNLALEQAQAERVNAAIYPAAAAAGAAQASPPRPAGGVVLLMAPFALVIGVAVFAFCPRFGAGMFGHAEVRGGGMAVTGLSGSIDFNTIGPISESERPVMRVKLELDGKATRGEETSLYVRGRVFDFYARSGPAGRGWDWQRSEHPRVRLFDREEDNDEEFNLLPDYNPPPGEDILTQRYSIDPGVISDPVLFCLYPPVVISGISSDEVATVAKSIDDQSLGAGHTFRRALHYSIRSPAGLTAAAVQALQVEREREGLDLPRPHPPDPPLPREDEIRDLLAPLVHDAEPLDVPRNREAFAERLAGWLRSKRFSYTLEPPSPRPGTEPVGEFLLRNKRGNCQHFASAMVVLCQLAGVPARLVSGFRCDNYNSFGWFWSVRGKHAHAWVEVYIPGRDWVRFDPTPFANGSQAAGDTWVARLRNYGEYVQFQWGNFVLAYDAGTRRDLIVGFGDWLMRPARNQSTVLGTVAAFVYELFVWRIQMSWQDRLLYWVFALLMVGLIVGTGYIVVVLFWRAGRWLGQPVLSRRSAVQRMGDTIFYHRLCRRLSALGLRRRPEQTPAEFAAEAAGRHPVLGPATALVGAYYEVVYGKRGLSPERRSEFEHFLRKLDSIDRAVLRGS